MLVWNGLHGFRGYKSFEVRTRRLWECSLEHEWMMALRQIWCGGVYHWWIWNPSLHECLWLERIIGFTYSFRVADKKSQSKSPEVRPVTGRAGCGCGIAKLGGLCTKFGESRRDAQIPLQASSQMWGMTFGSNWSTSRQSARKSEDTEDCFVSKDLCVMVLFWTFLLVFPYPVLGFCQ